jgi:hypothetical protein
MIPIPLRRLLFRLLPLALICPLAAVAADPPFGIGRDASAEEIASRDIDVGPDGAGLPPGGGSAGDGAKIYIERCAECHGVTGQHGRDWLAGGPETGRKTIGNYWPYATTIFDYVRRAMPPATPGTLSDSEVYALTAHLLRLNGIIGADEEMNAQTLPNVKMPARDRFVPDDRRGGAEIR